MIRVLLAAMLLLLVPGSVLAEDGGGDPRDPWEGFNRYAFAFNETVDAWVLEPAGKGWDFVLPDPAQESVSNFFGNLRFPIVFANDMFQGKIGPGAQDVARFLVNTTFGIAGFFDPATSLGLPRNEEDLGQTLGWWGFENGPYLVLPLFGPSTVRDGIGLVGDYPLSVTPFFVGQYILLGAQTVDIVNARSLSLEEIENAREASLDFYIFVRDAYLQRRAALVEDREELSEEEEEDLYYFDEEE